MPATVDRRPPINGKLHCSKCGQIIDCSFKHEGVDKYGRASDRCKIIYSNVRRDCPGCTHAIERMSRAFLTDGDEEVIKYADN